MSIQFYDIIRDVEVQITADDFDGDTSVGIEYGPETVTARRLDNGLDFELTEDEVELASIHAAKIYYEDVPDFPDH